MAARFEITRFPAASKMWRTLPHHDQAELSFELHYVGPAQGLGNRSRSSLREFILRIGLVGLLTL
jgi:hypothetical protein